MITQRGRTQSQHESDRILFQAAFIKGKVTTKRGLGAYWEVSLKEKLDLLKAKADLVTEALEMNKPETKSLQCRATFSKKTENLI